jgi:hypothetical protein
MRNSEYSDARRHFTTYYENRMSAVRQPIQQGRRHPLALEDLAPLGAGQVARDQEAAPFIALGEQMKEQVGCATAERQVAPSRAIL